MATVGLPWAADNGAFSGFNPAAFERMLKRIEGVDGCLFVACPDAVRDATATVKLFGEWSQRIRAHGLPVAFVLQDGIQLNQVPWDEIDAVFIGGSTEWKLSEDAELLAIEAKARGKWVHMGRVNTMRRLRHAYQIGCDSVDGTSAARWGDVYLPLFVKWMRRIERDRVLF